jgi:transposase
LRPHKSSYWIHPKIEDEQEFILRLKEIGKTYKEAIRPGSKVIVSSCDEKTGIQALQHLQVDKMKPGREERKDPEYERNGSTTLIASFEVKTGKVNAYSLGKTRKEEDFLEHVKDIVATNPKEEHIIICDQLNIHKSVSLVKYLARHIQYKGDLGAKRKNGILFSMESRMKFLEDKSHRVRLLYTPKHCSWMNQIENWFGLLQKKVIARGEFASVEILEEKIRNFIQYYNKCLIRPLNWKSEGESYSHELTY